MSRQLPGLFFPSLIRNLRVFESHTLCDSFTCSRNNGKHGNFVGFILFCALRNSNFYLALRKPSSFIVRIAEFIEEKWSANGFQEFGD